MKLTRLVSTVVATLVYASASCAAQLAFPPSAPLEVVVLGGTGNPQRSSISPEDPKAVKLRAWLAKNQAGWLPYLATTPGRGIIVSGGELRLQFVGTSVLACPKQQACLHKSIGEGEYGFLKSQA